MGGWRGGSLLPLSEVLKEARMAAFGRPFLFDGKNRQLQEQKRNTGVLRSAQNDNFLMGLDERCGLGRCRS